MNDQYRFDAEAILDPDNCEFLLDGASGQLVTVRLFDGPDVACSATGETVHTAAVSANLRPSEARRLAARLVEHAEHAERTTRQSFQRSLERARGGRR